MTLLDEGLNRIRDLVSADLYAGVAGTGTTAISFTETELVTPIASAEDTSLIISPSTRTLTITHYIPTTSANGNELTEWGIESNSGNTLISRSLTAPVSKTASIEINRVTLIYFDRK